MKILKTEYVDGMRGKAVISLNRDELSKLCNGLYLLSKNNIHANRYDKNLTAAARLIVDGASIFTYKDKSSSGADTTVYFSEIITELRGRMSPSSGRVAFFNINSESTQTGLIIAIIAGVTLVAVGGYFFLRKRKAN